MFNAISLIESAGYFGVFVIIFAETGLLIGLFLPGDSLLVTAGILASQGHLNIIILCGVICVGAILGDNVGYWLGRKFGPAVFSKKGSVLLNPDHLVRAQTYYDRYGALTLVIARFMPVLRTLAPTMAGVGRMKYRIFLTYSIISGILWGIGLPILGFLLGKRIPGIDKYIVPIVLGIVLISIAPGLYNVMRNPESRMHLKTALRHLLHL